MTARLYTITSILSVSLLLTACGSSPPVRYFALSDTVPVGVQDAEDAVVLGVGPMRMAPYLDRSQIVMRGPGAEIEIDEFVRWAEPLSTAFLRVVSADVDNAVNGLRVIAFPWESAVWSQIDYRLLGEVIRFDGDPSGRVVLETQWGIVATDSDVWPVKPRRRRYESQMASPDDPASLAAAMGEALAKFSSDIVSELRPLLKQ